jgi:hypothetical protein
LGDVVNLSPSHLLGPFMSPSCTPPSSKAVEIAKRLSDTEEIKATLCVRMQRELKMRPHEAVAAARSILSRPEAHSIDAAVRSRGIAPPYPHSTPPRHTGIGAP